MPDATAIPDRLTEIALLGDAAWFAEHPERRIRIRKAVASEFDGSAGAAADGAVWHVLVLEAQPGARMRQPVALAAGTATDAMTDEQLFAIFMQVAPPEAMETLRRLRATKLPGAR